MRLTAVALTMLVGLGLVVFPGCRSSRQRPPSVHGDPNVRQLPAPGGFTDAEPPADDGSVDAGPGRSPDATATPPMDARPPLDLRVPVDIPRPVDGNTSDAGADQRPPMDAAPEPPSPMACPAMTAPAEVGVFDVGVGNCSFPVGELPAHVVAVDSQLYAAGAACGTCIELSHGANKVIAMVVDQYPTQPGPRGNKLSLGRAAFSKLTGLDTGLLGMGWRRVPCPVTGPITAALKNGSSVFYWEVIFQNVANPIASLEFMNATDLLWTRVKREHYNYFRQPSASNLPARFRLTDVHGNVVVTPTLSWPNPVTKSIPIGVQFPAACVP